MRILVTGASGFIGRHLVQGLVQKSYDVCAVVRPGNLPCPPPVKTVFADLAQPGWTLVLPGNSAADTIIHLAQSRQFRLGLDHASDLVQVNVSATTELLSWGRAHGVKRFFLASSGSVYGKDNPGACFEDQECAPEGVYALTKHLMELISRLYESDMSISILRLFGVYGPEQEQGLVKTIFEKVRVRQKINLVSVNGLNINPIFVQDCTDCIIKLLGVSHMPSVMNIAGREIISIRELALKIGEIIKIEPIFEMVGGKAESLIGDTTIMKRYGFADDFIDLSAGLRTIANLRSNNR